MSSLGSSCRSVAQRLGESLQAVGGAVSGRYSDFARAPGHAARVLECAYQPSELELAVRVLDSDSLVRQPQVTSSVWFIGRSWGNARSVFKPGWLENLVGLRPEPLRYGIPSGGGHLARREQAAYRVDEAFGFGRVPPTSVIIDSRYGIGSNQAWVYSRPTHALKVWDAARKRHPLVGWDSWLLNRRYPLVQRQQMAVLDYVIGNTDRHLGNYRTGREGDIVAIDHGLSFPEFPDQRVGIRSPFVHEFRDIELREEVMAKVRAVDLDQLRMALLDSGISEKATDGALLRLQEIRDNGKITGENWPGPIYSAPTLRATGPLPAGWIEADGDDTYPYRPDSGHGLTRQGV